MKNRPILFLVLTVCLVPSVNAQETLNLMQILARINNNNSDLLISQHRIKQSLQNLTQIQSQLGWFVSGKTGATHDLSFTGTPADTFDISANMQKKTATGATMGFGTSYSYQDNEFAFPGFPNPTNNLNLNFTYRRPLFQGAGNPNYHYSITQAEENIKISKANVFILRKQLAQGTIDLFHAALSTKAQIVNAENAIARAKRLKKYILANENLGLTEKKDRLQSNAQIQSQIAAKEAMLAAWIQQRSQLNLLMNEPTSYNFEPALPNLNQNIDDVESIIKKANDNNPELKLFDSQLKLAQIMIDTKREDKKDTLDVLFTAGTRTRIGSVAATGDNQNPADINESDWAGSIGLEYRRAVDKSGFDAGLYQAQINRTIVQQEIENIKRKTAHKISSLVDEINLAKTVITSYKLHLEAEEIKFNEAEDRYQTGRTDTARLIQFESELYGAQLSVTQQQIELARKYATLALERGEIWDMTDETMEINQSGAPK